MMTWRGRAVSYVKEQVGIVGHGLRAEDGSQHGRGDTMAYYIYITAYTAYDMQTTVMCA